MAPSTTHLVDLIDRYKDQRPEMTDAAIARSLGMTPANLSLWRSKGVRGWPARSTLDALAATIGRPYREVLDAALADTGYTPPAVSPRSYAEVLADAIAALTEATRLTNYGVRQTPSGGWEPDKSRPLPIDWAEFVCHARAAAAANVGGIDAVLAGRSGSWEAAVVREVLTSTVGHDEHALWQHRTTPVDVVIRPEQILADIETSWFQDEDLDDEELDRRENAISPSWVYSYPGHELDDHARAHYARRGVTVVEGTPPPVSTPEEIEAAIAAEQQNPTELTTEEQVIEDALDDLSLLREQLGEERREELRGYGEQIAAAVRQRLEEVEGLTVPITVTVELEDEVSATGTTPKVEVDPRGTTGVIDTAIATAITSVPDPGTWPGTPLSRLEAGDSIVFSPDSRAPNGDSA